MGLDGLLQPGAGSPVLLMAAALLLGALHALEPGHAKTLMAAFIVAVRGTASQAIILGLSVAASHTLIVWLVAWIGWGYGNAVFTDARRGYFIAAAGLIILIVGVWSASRSWLAQAEQTHHHHGEGFANEDAHARAHAADLRRHAGSGKASTGQVILFGLSGGLIPCSAAVSVLLICMQQQRLLFGIGLVAAFTAGLALTLIAIGVAAASGTAAAGRDGRLGRLQPLLRYAPSASGVILAIVGLLTIDGGLVVLGI